MTFEWRSKGSPCSSPVTVSSSLNGIMIVSDSQIMIFSQGSTENSMREYIKAKGPSDDSYGYNFLLLYQMEKLCRSVRTLVALTLL